MAPEPIKRLHMCEDTRIKASIERYLGGNPDSRLASIEIAKIEHRPWKKERLEDAVIITRETGLTNPVFLVHAYEGPNGYEVSDGMHRIAAAAQLGYTHIIAVVSPYDIEDGRQIFKQRIPSS